MSKAKVFGIFEVLPNFTPFKVNPRLRKIGTAKDVSINNARIRASVKYNKNNLVLFPYK